MTVKGWRADSNSRLPHSYGVESVVRIRGRPATAEEVEKLGRQKAMVCKVDDKVIGRNGCHLVSRLPNRWVLGPRGEKWLEVLTF